MRSMPSISTDQVSAFVQLARTGSLRAAAGELHITEQGVRNRLLALEQQLGVGLYHKRRGVRRSSPLTRDGQKFLPAAVEFLERAQSLGDMFAPQPAPRQVRVAASQYLIAYVLIDAIRRFHAAHPDTRVVLSAHSEQEIERELLDNAAGVHLGVAAPYEASTDLEYRHLFSMNWSLITPRRHPLLNAKRLRLEQVAEYPLITYERGSTGRQHIFEAFHRGGITPDVEVETTNTDLIVRMVEANLGVAIAPLLPSGIVTRGRRVATRDLGQQIRSIDSGILTRKNESMNESSRRFTEFIHADWK